MASTTTSGSAINKADLYLPAVYAVQGGMSIRMAARKYNVKRESLRVRVRGYVPVECRPGPQLFYINGGADQGLLEAIFYRASHGLSMNTSMFRDLVHQAAVATSIKDVPADFPNVKWVQRWMKKHSDVISYRKGRILDAKRVQCSTEGNVRYYFNNLSDTIAKLKLEDKPAQIWNCDETGVTAQGACNERVICAKGMSANVQRSADRENVSIMGCINASGGFIPPLYIFAGARRKLNWIEKGPAGAKCQVSDSSNINRISFQQWFEWLVSLLPPIRPQLLVLDGHFAHISLDVVKYGLDNSVHIFVLPAHASHFLQPLDVGVYQPFKSVCNTGVSKYPISHEGALPVKDDVAEISKRPFKEAFSERKSTRGFRDTGIFPLPLEVMLTKMVGNKPAPNVVTMRYHSMIVPHFNGEPVDSRTQAALERRGLDHNTLNVVRLSLLIIVAPQPEKRPKGDFIDEKISGGKLLSYEEMRQDILAKKEEKREKERKKQAAKFAKESAKREEKRVKEANKQAAKLARETSSRTRKAAKLSKQRGKRSLDMERGDTSTRSDSQKRLRQAVCCRRTPSANVGFLSIQTPSISRADQGNVYFFVCDLCKPIFCIGLLVDQLYVYGG